MQPNQQQELVQALRDIVEQLVKHKLLPQNTQKETLVQTLSKTMQQKGIVLDANLLKMPNMRNKLGLSLIATNNPSNQFDIGVIFKNANDPSAEKNFQSELDKLMNKLFEKILELKPDNKMSDEQKKSAKDILAQLSKLLLNKCKDDPRKLNNLVNAMLQLKTKLDGPKPSKKLNDNVEVAKENEELFHQLFGTSPVPGSAAIVVQAVSIGDQIGAVYQGSAQDNSFEAKKYNADAGGSVDPLVAIASLVNDIADGNINSKTELDFATTESPKSANWPPKPTPLPRT